MKNFFFAIIILQGCFPSFKPDVKDRNIIKQLQNGLLNIEWYNYSSAYADSPDFITFTKDGIIDTICKSDNIADIQINDKKDVIISFYGAPKLYTDTITIPIQSFNYIIKIDSASRRTKIN